MKHNVTLRCFAEGSDGHWEAICLDFDLAVQGKTFDEVHSNLRAMISDYIDTVSGYPEPDKRKLLSRKAPLGLRLKFTLLYVVASLFGSRACLQLSRMLAQAN